MSSIDKKYNTSIDSNLSISLTNVSNAKDKINVLTNNIKHINRKTTPSEFLFNKNKHVLLFHKKMENTLKDYSSRSLTPIKLMYSSKNLNEDDN